MGKRARASQGLPIGGSFARRSGRPQTLRPLTGHDGRIPKGRAKRWPQGLWLAGRRTLTIQKSRPMGSLLHAGAEARRRHKTGCRDGPLPPERRKIRTAPRRRVRCVVLLAPMPRQRHSPYLSRYLPHAVFGSALPRTALESCLVSSGLPARRGCTHHRERSIRPGALRTTSHGVCDSHRLFIARSAAPEFFSSSHPFRRQG